MDRTQEIKDAHPWLSYEEVVKVSGFITFRETSLRGRWKRLQSFLNQRV